MLVVTYVHSVVGTMPGSGQDAMSDAEDHADNSAATAAAADDGLSATTDRKPTDQQAHADDAHAAGADAADENPIAEDATDKDGDADGVLLDHHSRSVAVNVLIDHL